jgi:DNA modification methylase
MGSLGPFELNRVAEGDCLELSALLPSGCVDVIVTSPPYWGQRLSRGIGDEEDPRVYLDCLVAVFDELRDKLSEEGIVWINLGDAYNTPVNWRAKDHQFSTLGATGDGLAPDNTAYTKPRAARKAFTDKDVGWLRYGNLLDLPHRMIEALCDRGYLFRGEVIWHKQNAMPEGRCRRPHRHHESIYLLAKSEKHRFRVSPPVKSVWEFANERIDGPRHSARFPEALPRNAIEAYGDLRKDTLVLDPFSGSGTSGIAARKLNCSYLGFEIEADQVAASNDRLADLD